MLIAGIGPAAAADWPRFRGADCLGVSAESIPTPWPSQGLLAAWTWPVPEGGTGYGSAATWEGRVFALASCLNCFTDGRQEYCVALDAASGSCVWATQLNLGSRANSTPTVADGSVYVYSSECTLCRLDAATGSVWWKRDLQEEYGGGSVPYGNSQSPWVEDGRVFVQISAETNCLMAFDASTGDLLWRGHTNGLTYGSPVGATIHGVRQIIFPDPNGLVAVTPDSGQMLWQHSQNATSPSYSYDNGPSPVVHGDVAFCSNKYGTQAVRIGCSDGVFSTEVLWTNRSLGDLYTTLVIHEDCVYGTSRGRLHCLELTSGRVRWQSDGTVRMASVILVGNRLLAQAESGELILAEASPLKYQQLGRSSQRSTGSLNSPAFCGGRIYVRSLEKIVCLDTSPLPPIAISAALVGGTDRLRLTVSCSDGSLLSTNRASRISIRLSANPGGPFALWSSAAASLTYTNGVLCAEVPIVSTGPPQFYIAVE